MSKLKLVPPKPQDDQPPVEGVFGLYDTRDDVWMGNDEGPKTFPDYMVARVAAEMVDVQLGQYPGRTKAKEYLGGATHLRDEVRTRMGSLEALRRMETGRVC